MLLDAVAALKRGDVLLVAKRAIPDGGTGAATTQASVVFVGLPAPPTPEEAERLRLPVGSNVIVSPSHSAK